MEVDEIVSTDSGTSTGFLDQSAGPDTNAQSIAAGIIADLDGKPIVPKKAGRPKKKAVEVMADEDSAEDAPVETPEPAEDEPEATDESDTEAKEGDDDQDEPTELDDQLRALAESYGVPLSDIEDAETVGEAERSINRLYRVFAREAQYEQRNGHAEREPEFPAATAVQKKKEALELDLSKYDDDEPVKAHLKQMAEHSNRLEQELSQLRDADRQRQEAEFYRVQQNIAREFQQELHRLSPELFGTEKKQDRKQAQRLHEAFVVGDQMLRGAAAAGRPVGSMSALAKLAANAKFAEQLTQKQILAKREKVEARQQRRSVGAPARNARPANGSPGCQGASGGLAGRPGHSGAIRSVQSRYRD